MCAPWPLEKRICETTALVGVNTNNPSPKDSIHNRNAALSAYCDKMSKLSKGFYLARQTTQKGASGEDINSTLMSPMGRFEDIELLIIGHIDVVAPKGVWSVTKPQEAKLVNCDGKQRLYGLGAFDMKAGLVNMLEIAERQHTNVGFLVVTDEETGGFNGAKYWAEKVPELKPSAAMTFEYTNLTISGNNGFLNMVLAARGKSGHASRPWESFNPACVIPELIMEIYANAFFEKESKYTNSVTCAPLRPTPGCSKIFTDTILDSFGSLPAPASDEEKKNREKLTSLEELATKFSENKIPDNVMAIFDARFPPDFSAEGVEAVFKTAVLDAQAKYRNNPGYVEITAERFKRAPYGAAVLVDENNAHVKRLASALEQHGLPVKSGLVMPGAMDVRFFFAHGIPSFNFGLDGKNAHGSDEYVTTDSMQRHAEVMKTFLESL